MFVWHFSRRALWLTTAAVLLFNAATWRFWAQDDLDTVDTGILAGQTVAIDAGHGGVDGGSTGYGRREKHITLQIAARLAERLEQCGARVVMTRRDDTDYYAAGGKRGDLLRRAAIINESGAAAFVSIHTNAMRDSRWFGAQVFYNPRLSDSKLLAETVQRALRNFPPGNKRQAKQDREILLLKETNIPGVLAEVGFLSNSQESALLADEQYQERIAAALVRALAYHFQHHVAR